MRHLVSCRDQEHFQAFRSLPPCPMRTALNLNLQANSHSQLNRLIRSLTCISPFTRVRSTWSLTWTVLSQSVCSRLSRSQSFHRPIVFVTGASTDVASLLPINRKDQRAEAIMKSSIATDWIFQLLKLHFL